MLLFSQGMVLMCNSGIALTMRKAAPLSPMTVPAGGGIVAVVGDDTLHGSLGGSAGPRLSPALRNLLVSGDAWHLGRALSSLRRGILILLAPNPLIRQVATLLKTSA